MSAARTGSLGAAIAKGDLYTLDSNKRLVRVAVGADGTVPAASAAAAGGFDWIYPLASYFEPLADAANAFNNYRVRNIGNGATSLHTFAVPIDFQSLVNLYLVFIPNASAAARTLTIAPNYGLIAQAVPANAPAATAYVNAYTGGMMTAVDFASAFSPALVASSLVGTLITNNDASTISVLGTLMQYRRKLT